MEWNGILLVIQSRWELCRGWYQARCVVTRGDVMSGAWTLHHYNHSIAAASSTNTRLLLVTHGAGVQNSGDYVDPADPPRPLHLHTLQNSGKVIVKQEHKAY